MRSKLQLMYDVLSVGGGSLARSIEEIMMNLVVKQVRQPKLRRSLCCWMEFAWIKTKLKTVSGQSQAIPWTTKETKLGWAQLVCK